MDATTRAQRRKQLVCLLDRDSLVRAIATPETTEAEILIDRQLADDAMTFRNVADPEASDRLGGSAHQLKVAEHHRTMTGFDEPGDRPDQRGLAGAGGSQHGGDAALGNRKRHLVERDDASVRDREIADLKHAQPSVRGTHWRRRGWHESRRAS